MKVAAAALIVSGLLWYAASGSDEKPTYFRFGKVDRGDITDAVTATGTLNAVTTVQVGSQVSGRVYKLFCDFNDKVKAEQMLAQIDPAPFEAQLQQAQASVTKARAATLKTSVAVEVARANARVAESEVTNIQASVRKAQVTLLNTERIAKRTRELAARSLVAPQEVDQAETELGRAKADVASLEAQVRSAMAKASAAVSAIALSQADTESSKGEVAQAEASYSLAKTNLQFCKIASPISGIVISRNVDIGQTVAASFQAPVLYLIADDLARMQITANVDEADIGRVKDGQEVTFTVDAFPDRQFKGKVSQIRLAPIVSQNVVTYHVVVDVENKDLSLMPGMTSNASILVARRKGVVRVPNAALAAPGERSARWSLRTAPTPMARSRAGCSPREATRSASPSGSRPASPTAASPRSRAAISRKTTGWRSVSRMRPLPRPRAD